MSLRQRHFDVIVAGTHLSAWICACTLARHGLRVLMLRGHEPPYFYRVEGFSLPRFTFEFSGTTAEPLLSALGELGITQSLKRQHKASDDIFQWLGPDHRINVDAELIQRPLLQLCLATYGQLSAVLGAQSTWPPKSLVEVSQFRRAAKGLSDAGTLQELFSSAWRNDAEVAQLIEATYWMAHGARIDRQTDLLFASRPLSRMISAPSAIGALPNGWQTLCNILSQKLQTFGGTVSETERVTRILVEKNKVSGVELSNDDSWVGCQALVWGMPHAFLHTVAGGHQLLDGVEFNFGSPSHGRYTLNMVVNRNALPEPLRSHVYWKPKVASRYRETWRDLHFAKLTLTHLDEAYTVATIETLVPWKMVQEDVPLGQLREVLLTALRDIIPFVEQHTVLIDSPHDGLPPQQWPTREPLDVEGAYSMRRERGRQSIASVYPLPVNEDRWQTIWGQSPQSTLENARICNDTLLPALEHEGACLAGRSIAFDILKHYKHTRKIRKGLWRASEI